MTKEELMQLIRSGEIGTRMIKIQTTEKESGDDVIGEDEHLDILSDQGFIRILWQKKKILNDGRIAHKVEDVAGICSVCGGTVHSANVLQCEYDGKIICQKDAMKLGSRYYCGKHFLSGLIKAILGI
jgi:hypothetical protein